MKRKKIFGKCILLFLVVSLLLGATVTGVSASTSTGETTETAAPWEGYTRITMKDYGIVASTDAAGTTYNKTVSGTYIGTSFNQTYLDVDIKYNYTEELNINNCFKYFGSGDRTDYIAFYPYTSGLSLKDEYLNKNGVSEPRDTTRPWGSCTTSGFFNVKILTDIDTNVADSTKEDVTLQFYVNGEFIGKMNWTEESGQDHSYFGFNWVSDSYTLRTPTVEGEANPWAGYTRITMQNYGITASSDVEGTTYTESVSGTYNRTLNQTYLDVDVKYNYTDELNIHNYFSYFGSGDGTDDIRFYPYTSGLSLKDEYLNENGVSEPRDTTRPWGSCKASEFFNVKILTDIDTNVEDSAKEDVMLQFYVNGKFIGRMTWTEDAGLDHSYFYFNWESDSYVLRTPIIDPGAGYTRITLEDYGITASSAAEGTTFTEPVSGIYTGTSLAQTYLDVDINFNGTDYATEYFHYFGSDDWVDNLRFTPTISNGIQVQDWYGYTEEGGESSPRADLVDTSSTSSKISADQFFNLKIMTDIARNASDTTMVDVRLRFYVDNYYVGEMAWTEALGQNHNNFYFYCGESDSYTLRTPAEQEEIDPWAGYNRITLEDYGMEAASGVKGTEYNTGNVFYRYTGDDEVYTADDLQNTYLEFDLNYNGSVSTMPDSAAGISADLHHSFDFFGDGTVDENGNHGWKNHLRLVAYEKELTFKDEGTPPQTQDKDPAATYTKLGISKDEFFNIKILFNIMAHPEDDTKQNVVVQMYINNNAFGKLTWTENVGVDHSCFYFWQIRDGETYSLRTPSDPRVDENGYNVYEYRKKPTYEYPTREGYVFGGWYEDAYYTNPVDRNRTEGYDFAKFVKRDVLTFKYQKLANFQVTDEKTSLRLLTSVDSLDYRYIGFKLEYESDDSTVTKSYKTRYVYEKITGQVNGQQVEYYPNLFSDASAYIMGLKVNKIPQKLYETTLTITPQWYTWDGTTVDGTPRDIVLSSTTTGSETMDGTEFLNDNIAYYDDAEWD